MHKINVQDLQGTPSSVVFSVEPSLVFCVVVVLDSVVLVVMVTGVTEDDSDDDIKSRCVVVIGDAVVVSCNFEVVVDCGVDSVE